jgi:hypothetical protein
MDYETVRDPSAATWLDERLTGFDGTVAGVLPTGFAAHARITHPAYRDDVPVTWQEVAAANGQTAHPLMQWDHIVGARNVREQQGLWDEPPYEGNVPEPLLRRLADVLRTHTATPDRCWFGLWDGWGGSAVKPGDTAAFEIPDRNMLLLNGPLDAVHRTSLDLPPGNAHDASVAVAVGPATDEPEEPFDREPFWRCPNLWWPDDQAWCVATDIDFTYTYVGGTETCIDAILAAPGIEAFPAYLIDPVTWSGDHVNPRPK